MAAFELGPRPGCMFGVEDGAQGSVRKACTASVRSVATVAFEHFISSTGFQFAMSEMLRNVTVCEEGCSARFGPYINSTGIYPISHMHARAATAGPSARYFSTGTLHVCFIAKPLRRRCLLVESSACCPFITRSTHLGLTLRIGV